MVTVPADTAVTTPEAFTEATPEFELDQAPVPLPPRTTELAEYVAVAPIHNGDVPVTDAMDAFGLTVTD